MPKEDDEEANAYTSLDDWQVEDVNALKSSIQQHAELIGGGDDTLQDDDDLAAVPVKPGQKRIVEEQWKDEPSTFAGRSLQPALRSARKTHGYEDKSVMGNTSKVSFSPEVPASKKGDLKTPAQLRKGTRLRALFAVLCLTSFMLVLFLCGEQVAHILINQWSKAKSDNVAPLPEVQGIPPPVGNYPAYNATFPLPDLESMNIILSPEMENYADWRIPFPAFSRTEIPVFWSIPKAGGQVIQRILGQCLGLVEVTSDGAGREETSLLILETVKGIRHLNVDSTTVEGLNRAKELGLAKSGLADALFTNLISDAARIFNPVNRGRLFAIFRHPLPRAMSQYNYAKVVDPLVAEMSIADYAANFLPNNEMVRILAGLGSEVVLTDDDLYYAMEVLRRKFVVGLVDRMEESLTRFHLSFGWSSLVLDEVSACQAEFLAQNIEKLTSPAEGTAAYNFMIAQNRLDLRLFEYAQYMYDLQGGNVQSDK